MAGAASATISAINPRQLSFADTENGPHVPSNDVPGSEINDRGIGSPIGLGGLQFLLGAPVIVAALVPSCCWYHDGQLFAPASRFSRFDVASHRML